MNWNHLSYILAIAEQGSITRAAQALFLSQPSLSLSLKSLEEELGVQLFRRSGGVLQPTYAGELYCAWARSVLRSHDRLRQKLDGIAQQRRQRIRLGISPHRAPLLLPPILRAFYSRWPDCELQVVEKPTYQLKELLEQGALDLIIDMAHPDTVNYMNTLLAEEQVLLAVPESFVRHLPGALREAKLLPLEALEQAPFLLLPEDHLLGRICRTMCEAAAFQPQVRMTCSGVDIALRLAAQQLGVTFVPEIYAVQQRFSPQVRYFAVEEFQRTRQICLVYPRCLYLHPALESLMELFRQMTPRIYGGSVSGATDHILDQEEEA